MILARVGRYEFEYKEAPNYGPAFAVMCADFRPGQEYVFAGVVCLNARAAETTEISVAVTASNFHGTADDTKAIERTIETLHISKLVDLNALKITAPVPMQELLNAEDYKAIDWKALADEGEDVD